MDACAYWRKASYATDYSHSTQLELTGPPPLPEPLSLRRDLVQLGFTYLVHHSLILMINIICCTQTICAHRKVVHTKYSAKKILISREIYAEMFVLFLLEFQSC